MSPLAFSHQEASPQSSSLWGLCPYNMSSHSQHWFLWLSYHLWYSHTNLVRPEQVLINLMQWCNSCSLMCFGSPGKMGSSAIRNSGYYASFVSFSETGWWICWLSSSLPAPDLAVYGKGAIAMKSLFTNTAPCALIAILGLALLIIWISEEVSTMRAGFKKLDLLSGRKGDQSQYCMVTFMVFLAWARAINNCSLTSSCAMIPVWRLRVASAFGSVTSGVRLLSWIRASATSQTLMMRVVIA